jgi:tetratricopeptide (TPR) repeat protein
MVLLLAAVAGLWWIGGFQALPVAWARRSLRDRELPSARHWLQVASRLGPAAAEIDFLQARIARLDARPREFEQALDAAAAKGFDREALQREEALILLASGQLEPFEDKVGTWLEGPDQLEVCEAYANGLASRAEFEKLELILDAWARDYPADPQPHYRRGRIREHQRRLEAAEQEYRLALGLKANYYPAAYALGRLLLDRKENSEALALFERCLAMPENTAAKVGVGLCKKALGKIPEAHALLLSAANDAEESRTRSYRAVGEPSGRLVAATELGKLESELGNHAEAIRWLKLPVEQEPRDITARYAYALALRASGAKEAAERELEAVASLREKVEEAGKLLDYLKQSPEDVEARCRVGVLLLECNSDQTGLYWLKSVLAVDPQHGPTHEILAKYYEQHAKDSELNQRMAAQHRAWAKRP